MTNLSKIIYWVLEIILPFILVPLTNDQIMNVNNNFQMQYNGKTYSYTIRFSKMQATLYEVGGISAVENNFDNKCKVRRLSTPSFTERQIVVDSYFTQWRWYWKDDNGKWTIYSKVRMVQNFRDLIYFYKNNFVLDISNQFVYLSLDGH